MRCATVSDVICHQVCLAVSSMPEMGIIVLTENESQIKSDINILHCLYNHS
jgi:hypothetical protein